MRYRLNGTQQWKMVDTDTLINNVTITSVSLGNLPAGTYTYQVMAGCKDPSTGKETAPSSYTAAATF